MTTENHRDGTGVADSNGHVSGAVGGLSFLAGI